MRLCLLVLCLVLGACGLPRQPEPEFPIQIELSVGAQRRVPYNATLWLAMIDEDYDAGRRQIVPVARVMMECRGQERELVLQREQISEPACGVRVKLVTLELPKATTPGRAFFSLTKAE